MENRKAYLLVFLLAIIPLLLLFLIPPGSMIPKEKKLPGPYTHVAGSCYSAPVPFGLISDRDGWRSSRIALFENGTAMGPAHSDRQAIAAKGNGHYGHEGDDLYFSSSDGTNPNDNRREYRIVYSRTFLPLALYLGLLVFSFLLLLFLGNALFQKVSTGRRRLRPMAGFALWLILTGCFVELFFFSLTQDTLASSDRIINELYSHFFEGSESDIPGGLSLNYLPHHYMNYALNPDFSYVGENQYNRDYRIRRTEAVVGRERRAWRALVLGGSTTFGEGIPRESDTWVHQVEQRIRQRYGPDCDVINGGVGAYTVLENLIHYLVLLYELRPDVVILFEGINDVMPRMVGDLQPDYSNYRVPWRWEGTVLPGVNPNLAPFFFYRYLILRRDLAGLKEKHINQMTTRSPSGLEEMRHGLKKNGPAIYAAHLEQLVLLLRAQGCRVCLMPQVGRDRALAPREEIVYRGMLEHNRVNQLTAQQYGLAFFDELAHPGRFDPDDFWDGFHFNEEGSKKMAQYVYEFLHRYAMIEVLPKRTDP